MTGLIGRFAQKNTSTFIDNMNLPIHRWYRFPAGFSSEWVKRVISNHARRVVEKNRMLTLFDPFVGSGTTVLAGEEYGVPTIGIDSHPFLVRIGKAKLQWRSSIDRFSEFAMKTLRSARNLLNTDLRYPKLIHKCYSNEHLSKLDRLRRAWLHLRDGSPSAELTWLAIVCILRKTSRVGTAPWQYILPKRRKKIVVEPFWAFLHQVRIMMTDMRHFQLCSIDHPTGRISKDDARVCRSIEENSIDLIITSPPYPNNYDYADATRLEMSFLGEIEKWSDLGDKVRRHLVRSCSQHMSRRDNLGPLLKNRKLDPISEEIRDVCCDLEKERFNHGGRKNYHLMIAAYFSDLAEVWHSLRNVCRDAAKVCFVVGDSAPYGVYVPVDKWLGELAISAGFESYKFEKIRDRNVKWNSCRKHKIPLKEGRLWVE